MSDNLLQKIEERVLTLLNELEVMRNEITRLRQENVALKDDHDAHIQKLEGLLNLLDILEYTDHSPAPSAPIMQAQSEAVVA